MSGPHPPDQPGPGSLRLVPDPSLRVLDGGRALLGGSPLRVLRLGAAGAALVGRWLDGDPVTPRAAERALADRIVHSGLAHPRYPASRWGPADVAVVIPVRDDTAGAARVADAVAGVADVLVVDDGSAAPVPGAAVRHRRPRGPAAARNAGWHRTTAPLVAFLDADTAPPPGWLDPLLAQFADPAVAAVAPRVRSLPGRGALARYERARSSLDLGAEPGPVRPGGRIGHVPSAALVVRAEALAEVGGFDESLRFGEDVDLVWRLVAAGYQVRYEPAAEVGHAPRASWAGWVRQRFAYGTSAAPLARRHGSAVAPVRLSVWSAAAWAALLLGRRGTGAALVATSAALLVRKLGRVGVPGREAVRLAALGHLGAVRLLADALARPWAPLAWPLLRTRSGRIAAGLIAARHLVAWWRERPELDPVRWTAARLADDLAYGAGVCWGALRERSAGALLPHLTDLPGRSSVPVRGA
ncbi:mycofactocin biosynthesis glycosyltransferase MftF [Saccharopolyspora cebuensis]|uniref:mycofactocin biosynthesis glycosyltransferase MftF n=1 Tax=Saccharopolyspora cebuensis TaxID=418759 RepID=UPI0031EFD6A2